MIEKYALFKVFRTLRDSAQEESVRSLAKKAGVGVATSKRCLDYLFERSIVTRKIYGRLYQYHINNESLVARQMKVALSAAEIDSSGLVREVVAKYPPVTSIVWYGSTAAGIDNPSSDIDVVIITHNAVKLQSLEAEAKLSREVSLSVYTQQDWRRKALADKAYYDAVIIDGLSLYGELPVVR